MNRRFSTRYVLFCLVVVVSCKNQDNKESPGTEKAQPLADTTQKAMSADTEQKTSRPKGSGINSDTLTIDKKSAVFYQPTEKQIEKQKKETGEEAFYTGADDFVFYLSNCRDYFQKQKLAVVDAKDKKLVKFVLLDQSVKLIKPDTLPMLWGVFLFDPSKMPYDADMTNIEEEFKNYYR